MINLFDLDKAIRLSFRYCNTQICSSKILYTHTYMYTKTHRHTRTRACASQKLFGRSATKNVDVRRRRADYMRFLKVSQKFRKSSLDRSKSDAHTLISNDTGNRISSTKNEERKKKGNKGKSTNRGNKKRGWMIHFRKFTSLRSLSHSLNILVSAKVLNVCLSSSSADEK